MLSMFRKRPNPLVELLKQILDAVWQILSRLPPIPTHIHSSFKGVTMPVTLAVGQTVVQTITESNASGNVPVVAANLSNSSSDPTIASVVNNNDGTFTWTAVGPGTATSSFADTKFNLSGTDTLTVTQQAPTAIASTFGTPQ